MSSRNLEEIYGMYDQAAEEYRRAVQLTKQPDAFGVDIARYNAREWAKRMKWLDLKLNELAVENKEK